MVYRESFILRTEILRTRTFRIVSMGSEIFWKTVYNYNDEQVGHAYTPIKAGSNGAFDRLSYETPKLVFQPDPIAAKIFCALNITVATRPVPVPSTLLTSQKCFDFLHITITRIFADSSTTLLSLSLPKTVFFTQCKCVGFRICTESRKESKLYWALDELMKLANRFRCLIQKFTQTSFLIQFNAIP